MPLTRRELLKSIGTLAGTLGFTASGYEHLIPYLKQPDNIVPGVSTWYATSCRECPAGCGMIVENRQSRVIKCEGNPAHPIGQGTLCARGQAALHGLYDPDRIKTPMKRRPNAKPARFDTLNWNEALDSVGEILSKRGRIAFLSTLQTGSLDTLIRTWLAAFGSGRFIIYEPIDYLSVKAAVSEATGTAVVPNFDLDRCDFLISFDADFLETWISPIEFAHRFAAMREIKNGNRGRFVYVGSRVSMTAANADQRLIVPPGTEGAVALAITSELGGTGVLGGFSADEVGRRYKIDPNEIRTIARGLRAATTPLALPGGNPESARAAMFLNGVVGSTLVNTGRPHAVSGIADRSAVTDLMTDLENGAIDTLVVYDANPVYSFPNPKRCIKALQRVPNLISLSSTLDETTAYAHWVLPSTTPLESWGDYAPEPGVLNLLQPTMGMLFNVRQPGDTLIDLARRAGVDLAGTLKADNFYEYLRLRWGSPVPAGGNAGEIDPQWESIVKQGGRWTETLPAATGSVRTFSVGNLSFAPETKNEIRLKAYPHPYLYDGRNANRRWLQEIPEPVIKASWSSWAELHPDTARRLGVNTGDLVQVSRAGHRVQVPAYLWEGVRPGTIAIALGQGHTRYGRFASGTGVNIWPLLEPANQPIRVQRVGGKEIIPLTQKADAQHHREIVRTVPLKKPVERGSIDLPLPAGYKWTDFYPSHEHTPHRWAMVVDLNRCIGCNACVAACYAENNVAVVGADGTRRNRQMAWLRIDRYLDWKELTNPIQFQPMLCQHCDVAPCEPVCPVYAAVHSPEGVNEQIYNRCVGTRYCSNNCPYKVRRFNWFHYDWPRPLNYQLNPDVTVRDRGVMEKCTFCIQRIREVEIVARREGRAVRDGEIIPACAQTCPTGVYTFGDLMDPNAAVTKLIQADPRVYQVLDELNTKPGVIYLKRVIE